MAVSEVAAGPSLSVTVSLAGSARTVSTMSSVSHSPVMLLVQPASQTQTVGDSSVICPCKPQVTGDVRLMSGRVGLAPPSMQLMPHGAAVEAAATEPPDCEANIALTSMQVLVNALYSSMALHVYFFDASHRPDAWL